MLVKKDNLQGDYCLFHWKDEAPDWCLDIFPAPLRARQHASSRQALAELLNSKNISLDSDRIEIINYHNIKGFPDQLCSLSHTKDGWAVALINNHEKVLAVGIDLEFANRSFKSETKKLFVNDQDNHQELLKLWCQKEAAFKAIFPLLTRDILNKAFVLKDIFIKNNKFGLLKDGIILGFLDSEIVKHQGEEFLITTAFVSIKPI
jgi:phosphopantetheinyl transferase (holo-ACP synthase)